MSVSQAEAKPVPTEIPVTFTTCKEQQTRCGKRPGTRREQLVICVSDHMVSTSVLVDCHTERISGLMRVAEFMRISDEAAPGVPTRYCMSAVQSII